MAPITIIIPTIDRPSLQDAVQSVMDQKIKCTLIVVGDGVHPKVRDAFCLAAPKSGKAAVARNFAMKFVLTPWVGFLDDDDELSPDYTKHFMSRDLESDVLVFNMDTGEKILPYRQILRYGNIGINFAAKTEHLKDLPFPEVQNGLEDWGIIDRFKRAGLTFEFIPYTDYIVRPKERR